MAGLSSGDAGALPVVRRALNFCAAVAVAALVGCERPTVEPPANPDAPLESDVVAAVDDVTLTWGELARLAPEGAFEARRQVIERFIFTTLLVKEAQAHGIVLDDAAWRTFSAQFAEATGLTPEAYARAHGDAEILAALRREALSRLFLERVVYKDIKVPPSVEEENRARAEAEADAVRRKMMSLQMQVALGADFAALVREHSTATEPIRVSVQEMEESWPPELMRVVTSLPIGAVTDVVEMLGGLLMYQVVAREGDVFTLRVLSMNLPLPNKEVADYIFHQLREEAYWAWFQDAFTRHRVRCPLFPDLAPAQ